MSISIKDFLEDCRSRGLTNHTIATYKSNVTTFLNFVGNPLNADIPILCKFLDYLKEMHYRRGKVTKKGVHSKTIRAYFSAISTYYDYLVFTKQISSNPILQFTRRYLSRIKEQYNGENSRQLISIDQMKQLINLDMPIQDKAILVILSKTGVRRGELLSMDRDDLNLEKNEIILKPKAKRTNRLVFFDNETSQVLRLFLEWRKPRVRSNALFISPLGFRIGKDDINEIVARYGSLSGLHDPAGSLNKKLTPHCFRHWFTTTLRRAGMPREFIQELRGDRRKDAIDIYDHIDLSELKDRYSECIPKLLEAPLKLHATDLEPVRAYGEITGAILALLRVHPGLMPGQIIKNLKYNSGTVSAQISRVLKYGYIQKDGQRRYSITSQGNLTLEKFNQGVTVSPGPQWVTVRPDEGVTVRPDEGVTVRPDEGVTVRPDERVTVKQDLRGKHRHAIYGFSLTLYEYIQRHEGLSTKAISNFFLKNKDYVKRYLYRLKDYGLIINDGGNWYPTSKEPIAESHFINSTSKAVSMEA